MACGTLVLRGGEQAAEGQAAGLSGESETPCVPCCLFDAR